MPKSIIKNDSIDLSTVTTDIMLTGGEKILAIYDTTGTKDNFLLANGGIGGSVKIVGGASDVFALWENIAGNWTIVVSSTSGAIGGLPIISKGSGIRLVITTNTSGAIKMEIHL